MHYRKFLINIFCLSPLYLFAQDITGLWKGTLYNDTTRQFYKYEIGISKEKGKFSGFSHTWFILDDKQYYGVKKVSVKKAPDGKIIIEDNGLIANNYPVGPSKNVNQLNILTLDASESVMTLQGPFTTNRTKEYHSLTGNVTLQRKNDFWQSALVPHLQELGLENKLSFVKEENDLLAFVEAKQDEAVLKQLEQQYQNQAKQSAKDLAVHNATKRAEDEKEKANTILAKKEAALKVEAQNDLAKQRAAKQQITKQETEEKIQAEKDLAKQKAASKSLAEKEMAKEEVAKQQLAKQQAEQKIILQKALAKKEAYSKELAEKELAEKELVKQKLIQQQFVKQQAEQKAKADKELAKLAATTTKPQEKEIVKNQPTTSFITNTIAAASVSQRKTVVQQTVEFSSDSLLLTLYDNGEVDGDTVSILMNGELIVAKQRLSTTASKKTIYIPSNTDRVELVMYAESLGSIPPNTGLLVIRDGKDLYEIRFSGDLQKNASIVFNRKKE